jgi:hypothetical protein
MALIRSQSYYTMTFRIYFLYLVLGFSAFILGCKKEDNTPAASLTAGPAVLIVSKEEGSAVFNIVSNQKWTISSDQSWATLSASSGANDGIITISYSANPQIARQAIITVSGGGIEARIKLNQAAGLDAISSSSLNPLPYAKGSFTVTVQSTTSWKLGLQDSSWLKSNIQNGVAGSTVLTLNYTLNSGTGTRENQIRFFDTNNNPLLTMSVAQLNSSQANLLFTGKWGVYKEYIVKVKPTGDSLYRNLVVSNPCELDDWIQIKEDTIAFYQGPVPCTNPGINQKIKANFNSNFSQITINNGTDAESYQIQKLTTDSLIIESIPPYPDNLKAKRWLVKKP